MNWVVTQGKLYYLFKNDFQIINLEHSNYFKFTAFFFFFFLKKHFYFYLSFYPLLSKEENILN